MLAVNLAVGQSLFLIVVKPPKDKSRMPLSTQSHSNSLNGATSATNATKPTGNAISSNRSE